VIVNGAVTWRHGAHTGARNGQVILRKDATG
jgi:N-acyl-D-amino-acid deacylase